MIRITCLLIIILLSGICISCAGSENPIENTGNIPGIVSDGQSSHRTLWGEWEIYIDPETLAATAVPVRTADIHVDIIQK